MKSQAIAPGVRSAEGDVSEMARTSLVSNVTPILAPGQISACKHALVLAEVKRRKGCAVRAGFGVGLGARQPEEVRLSRKIFVASACGSLLERGKRGNGSV